MAEYIQKFNSLEAYNAAEHDYPNISLVEGEGLIWEAESPEPDETYLFEYNNDAWHLLIDRDIIDLNITSVNSEEYPDVSASAIQSFIALGKGINGSTITVYLANGKGDEELETTVRYDSDNDLIYLYTEENKEQIRWFEFRSDKYLGYIIDFTNLADTYNTIEFTYTEGF